MLNEIQNERFVAFVRVYVGDHWGLVHLLDGLDVAELATLTPEEKEAVSAVVESMPASDGIADGLRDGEWSAAGSPGLADSVQALQRRLAEIRSAIRSP